MAVDDPTKEVDARRLHVELALAAQGLAHPMMLRQPTTRLVVATSSTSILIATGISRVFLAVRYAHMLVSVCEQKPRYWHYCEKDIWGRHFVRLPQTFRRWQAEMVRLPPVVF